MENDNTEDLIMPLMFEDAGAMDIDVDSIYFAQNSTHYLPSETFHSTQQSISEHITGPAENWNGLHAHDLVPQQSFPSSGRSSASSNLRLSNNSVFSNQQWRGSVASTSTTLSNISQTSRDHYISQAQHALNANSASHFQPNTASVLASAQILATYRSAPRSRGHSKNSFSTCVSRAKRSRRSAKEPRYWCTACKEGFREKYDWIRHEKTYQERSETYQCELCEKIYYLDKDFIHHHRESHRCQTRVEKKHAELSRRPQPRRNGWGCGFCTRFDSDWSERCNHVAKHFENGDHISKWSRTKVIFSLLQRPCLREAWLRLLKEKEQKQELNPFMDWDHPQVGRSVNNPESDGTPQLQDMLEFYTDQDPVALVKLAYEMNQHKRHPQVQPDWPRHGHTTTSQSQVTHSSTLHQGRPMTHFSISPDKPLPNLPPPVPPKNSLNLNTALDMANEFHQWLWPTLTTTLREDTTLPHNERDFAELDLDTLDSMNWTRK